MGWYDTVRVSEPNIKGPDYGSVVALNNSATDKFTKALEGIGNIFSEPERLKAAAQEKYMKTLDSNHQALNDFTDRQTKSQTSDAINAYNDQVSQIKASGLPIEEQMKQIQSISLGDKNSLADFSVLNNNKTAIDNELNNRLEKKLSMDQAKQFHDDQMANEKKRLGIEQAKWNWEKDQIINQRKTEGAAADALVNPVGEVGGYTYNPKTKTYDKVQDSSTGAKTMDNASQEQRDSYGSSIENINNSKDVQDSIKRLEELNGKSYTKEQLANDKFMLEEYKKVNGSNKNSLISGSGITNDDIKNRFNVTKDIDAKIYDINKKIGPFGIGATRAESEAAKIELESLNKKRDELLNIYDSSKTKDNMTFDEFKTSAALNASANKKEEDAIIKKLNNIYSSADKDLTSKNGVVSKETKFADPKQLYNDVYTSNVTRMQNDPQFKNVDINTIKKTAAGIANKAMENQATSIDSIKSLANAQAKQDYEETKKMNEETIKQKEKKIESLQRTRDGLVDQKKGSGNTVAYNGTSMKDTAAQKLINDDIETEMSEIESLKQGIKDSLLLSQKRTSQK